MCVAANQRVWRKAHPIKYKADKRAILLRRYGITPEILDAVFLAQEGKCAICRSFLAKPVIDHSHATGKFRALLCLNCNTGIGQLRENPAIMQAAIEYVEFHK